MSDLPLILIEVLLVFGGATVFAWWQFRDLARERRKRESAHAAPDPSPTPTPTPTAPAASEPAPRDGG